MPDERIIATILISVDCDSSYVCGALWSSGYSTLAFGFMSHGFESEYRIFSHHLSSGYSKLRLLTKCSLDDTVRRLL